mmetsp:Transcript_31197/g.100091  ORF Transcript_31197/g.100091 Transcript_31197/m.100091 type:complete len:447 (+) Transcript_31197:1073-2413(+)
MRGRHGRYFGNPYGGKICTKFFRERLFNGRYNLPDVHFKIDEDQEYNKWIKLLKESTVGYWSFSDRRVPDSQLTRLRLKYNQWVSGDCRYCSTLPPSHLAKHWMSKETRRFYSKILNMTQLAARGSKSHQRELKKYNLSKFFDRNHISLANERRFNNGRLRLHYLLHATDVLCDVCNRTWKRQPWQINSFLNESREDSTYDWVLKRTFWNVAAFGDEEDLDEFLTVYKVDINARDPEVQMCTALHHAANQDKDDNIAVLVRHGADVLARDHGNWTALHYAARNNSCRAISRLLSAGIPIELDGGVRGRGLKYAPCFTALHWAAHEGHVEAIRALVAHGANLEARNEASHTPLMAAIHWGHKDAVQVLVEAGGDLLAQNDLGENCIMQAQKMCLHFATVEYKPTKGQMRRSPLDEWTGPERWHETYEYLRTAIALKRQAWIERERER